MIKLDGNIINITQSNTGAIAFNFYGPSYEKYSLKGFVITFLVKKSKKDSDSDAKITKQLGDVIDNTVNVVLYPSDTSIPVGTYWWGLQIKKGDYVNQVASGPFYIKEGVIDSYE